MKTKIIPALFDQADAAMLLAHKGEIIWSNSRFRHLPEAYRKQTQSWALERDTEWLELDAYAFQRLTHKHYTTIIGYPGDRTHLQRTLLLKLLPELHAGGDPFLNTARVLGPLLGWSHCVVAKHKRSRSVDLLGHWHQGQMLPPQTQALAGSAAQGLYEGEAHLNTARALGREFPLDELLQNDPCALWIGHRIDLPDLPAVGHICAWGAPDHADVDTAAWLLALTTDVLSSWLLSHYESADKDYQPSQEARDQLTGLPGRHAFDQALIHAMGTYSNRGQDCLVALVDIEGLTSINDTYGSNAGDKLLHDFAQELLGMSRRKDQVFRFGGDEFLLLMPTGPTPPPVAKRLQKITLQIQTEMPEFRVNLATCLLSEAGGSSGELMLMIDQRLKKAKDDNRHKAG